MKKCLIFGAGVYDGQLPAKEENVLVIAADAGITACLQAGFSPDLVTGDFDSLGKIPEGDHVYVLPVKKDVTDLDAAVAKALENGCGEIHIYGGMGGRPDHTLANYSLLARLSQNGIKAFLYGDGYVVTAVTDGAVSLSGAAGKTVSVFSWTETSAGVTLTGLKYPLADHLLTNTFALGVSNSFLGGEALVKTDKGTLLIFTEK